MLKRGFTYGTVQMLAVLYLAIWTISPPMEIDLIYRLLALAAAAVWFVVLLLRENPVVLGKEQVTALFFMLAVILVTFIQSESFEDILKQIAIYMLVICFIMNYFYKDKWDELSGILVIVFILLIVYNFRTYSALVEDLTIARKIVRNDESTYVYLRQGIGGYSLVYPQVCVASAALAWTIKAFRRNWLKFAVGAVWAVSFVLLISKAGYSLALFTSAVGALILLFYRGKNGIAAFFVALAVFAGSMMAILYWHDFRNFLLEIFDGTAVAKKINDLVATGDSGAAEGSIQARMEAYQGSIDTIVQYPLIGALWKGSGGGHSAFLDITAKYGIFGAAMFSLMFYIVPRYYKKKYRSRFIISMANSSLVSLLFVSLLDSFTYGFVCMIALVLPMLFEDVIKWTGVKE
ncbi:MAG: hypothetical protein IIU80_07065 [Clostridia bacterium]|nr:hypothetical protein [Clostridia bacterium]